MIKSYINNKKISLKIDINFIFNVLVVNFVVQKYNYYHLIE